MDDRKPSNLFQRFWNWTQRSRDGDESRILEIQRAERAERAALAQSAERLCDVQKARTDSVLERLRPSHQATMPSPQPPGLPRGNRRSSVRGRRIYGFLDVEDFDINQRTWDEDNDPLWEKVRLGSYVAALACKEAPMADGHKSPAPSISPGYSLSSEDTRTPDELRNISLIEDPPTPPPPPPPTVPLCRRGVSRLPVLLTRPTGKDKEAASGLRSQTTKNKTQKRLENPQPPPRPPAAQKKTPLVTPLAPTPPKVPQRQRRGSQPGTAVLRPTKTISAAGKKKETGGGPKAQSQSQPLRNPVESLSICFSLLSSDDWMKKLNGLDTIKALAEHHPETLKTKLHEVCLVLIEEVKNLRSAVACAAMDTLAALYAHLQKTMDPEVEGTGRALLLKLAQTTSAFIHQQANLALDAMVDNCSHGRIVSALLNTGMSHRCAAVRSSMAQHLHQLADRLGAARVLTAGSTFTERFLTAVSKMSVDAAPEVRHHGQKILQDLALHRGFLSLWTKMVPGNDRRPLDKFLKKAEN